QLRGPWLDHDAPVEVRARAEAQVLVRGAGVAVGAGVKAAAVWIGAPLEADVRAVVVRQNRAAAILVDLQLGVGTLSVEVLDRLGRPGVRRVRDGTERAWHDGLKLALNIRPVNPGEPSRDYALAEELVGLRLPPGHEPCRELGALACE